VLDGQGWHLLGLTTWELLLVWSKACIAPLVGRAYWRSSERKKNTRLCYRRSSALCVQEESKGAMLLTATACFGVRLRRVCECVNECVYECGVRVGVCLLVQCRLLLHFLLLLLLHESYSVWEFISDFCEQRNLSHQCGSKKLCSAASHMVETSSLYR
jgi:hypothetical protein